MTRSIDTASRAASSATENGTARETISGDRVSGDGVSGDRVSGDRVERLATDDAIVLRIHSALPQPGWRPRLAGDQLRADHAGTPVWFEDIFYEVVDHHEQSAGGHCYDLALWDERMSMRAPREYSPESRAAVAAARREQARHDTMYWVVTLLAPLLSLLPADRQLQIEHRWGLPAAGNTARWALLLAVLGSVGVAMRASPRSLFLYLLAESMVRFTAAWLGSMPSGSALVCLPLEALRLVRRRLGRAQRDQNHEADAARLRAQEVDFDAFSRAVDSVEPVEVDGFRRLQVTSLLPKEHWTLFKTAIRFRDQLWIAVEREVLAPPPGQHRHGHLEGHLEWHLEGHLEEHRFLLEPLDEGAIITQCVDYDPREVQQLHRERLRRRYETWIFSLHSIWGALDWRLKQQLEAAFDFDAYRASRLNVALLALGGGVTALGQLGPILSQRADTSHLVALLSGALLVWECLVRWQQLRRGDDQGSLLARPLAGLARRMLRVGPRPAPERTSTRPPGDGAAGSPETPRPVP
jgi:hypothetical protein